LLSFIFLMLCQADPTEGFRVRASIPETELVVGEASSFTLTIEAAGEIDQSFDYRRESSPTDKLQKPILQLEVPDAVEILDAYLPEDERKGMRAWLEYYLDKPYGRLITEKITEIPFKLVRVPREGETLGLNLITYVNGRDLQSARFIRRRIDLPLRAGAEAVGSEGRRSDWGRGNTIQIGDRVADFELPVGDGTRLKLADHVGKTPIFILTYRADW